MLLSYEDWQVFNNFSVENIQLDENMLRNLKRMVSPKSLIEKIKMHYEKLKIKYGETWAKAIICSALIGFLSPIPGSSIITALPIVGLAEVYKWMKSNPDKTKQIQDEFSDDTEEIIKDLQPT